MSDTSPAPGPPSRRARFLVAGVLAVLALVLYLNAWVCDDAFITFRSVEQLHAGHGPRWNPHDRVQAFTHPLWLAVLALSRVVSARLYWNVLFLSFALTIATVLVLRRGLGDPWRWALAAALLLSSRAFVDFSTSGLENPLTHLLLAILLLCLKNRSESRSHNQALAELRTTALLAALLTLSRPDMALLAGPIVIHRALEARCVGWRPVARGLALGFSPWLAWTAFSIVYYGFPFPNTAYAKLGTGIDGSELWSQGWHYLAHTARWDTVTAAVVVGGLLVLLRPRTALDDRSWLDERPWLGAGMALYLAYVVRIGGDFMAGRLLTPVFLVSVWVVARTLSPAWMARVAGLVLIFNLAHPAAPWKTGADYRPSPPLAAEGSHGIADEKGAYFDDYSLQRYLRSGPPPAPPPLGSQPFVYPFIGFMGYSVGLDRIVVDPHGLADPLLARLPAAEGWRIGHFAREIPRGYLESLDSGTNVVANETVRELYREVRRVTQGPLFTAERWRAIVKLNLRFRVPECAAPPCRELEVSVLDPDDYRPFFVAGPGQVERVRRQGPAVVVEGWVGLGDERRQKVEVWVPVAPVESRLESVARPDLAARLGDPARRDAGFRAILLFAAEGDARRAADSLCVMVGSERARPALLPSDSPVCGRLLRER